jgi:hypothetical protein
MGEPDLTGEIVAFATRFTHLTFALLMLACTAIFRADFVSLTNCGCGLSLCSFNIRFAHVSLRRNFPC